MWRCSHVQFIQTVERSRSRCAAQIASLPHIELEFVSPGTGARHSSLFLVDTGAGGTEVMFHSRAARELKLLQDQRALYDVSCCLKGLVACVVAQSRQQ